ncbi:hypothetical protein [Dendronalium sp. ChiSLP03b]|uniref:hypothetical protein n=1 Tax=Dendronalium sp. ChiSLP03b TaxID=3075381 RepID=UPI002AD42F78|nr:hypothetical protein [Dendronalium sp. ChiSLP03b]MDZ8205646.1 hypothetical protein [Dendronalium sp. ChiSLP03b]
MFNLNAKRQKTIASLFCLSFSFVLIISCTAAPVINLANIVNAAGKVATLIDVTEKILYVSSNLLKISYEDIGKNIRSEDFRSNQKFSNYTIQKMEAQHLELSNKQKELDNSIDETNRAAKELFSILETRANQNSNSLLRGKQLHDISIKKETFLEKIKISENFSLKLRKSIQEYDNILNVFQVYVGLGEAQKYIETIDSVISQYKILNQEVQTALKEGRQIVANIAELPPQEPERTVITNASKENTTQQQNTSSSESKENKATKDDINTPDNAIVEYYQLINQQQYESSWAVLSSNFHRLKSDNNYKSYKEWWEKVASVKINSINLIENSKGKAVVDVKLKYFLKDGRQLDDSSRIILILDSNSKWLIDDKIKS